MWNELKQKKILGYDFDRQIPINEFIVDFYCKELKLAIEIDGSQHNNELDTELDYQRQNILENLGVRFLRFEATFIITKMKDAIKIIQNTIEEYN